MKIMILVNKNFEHAGYRAGVEYQMTTGKTPNLVLKDHKPGNIHNYFEPSCTYDLNVDTEPGTEAAHHSIREYCINYLFPDDEHSSYSDMKYGLLCDLLEKCETENWIPDWIISVSTSESCTDIQGEDSVNGCVFLGNYFFACDCRQWDEPAYTSLLNLPSEPLMESRPIISNLTGFVADNQDVLTNGMKKLPNHPAKHLCCIANAYDISLGVINITNYRCYKKADQETYNEYKNKYGKLFPIGLETTHAVVRMAAEGNDERNTIPVLYVSPIVDRFGEFDTDVDGNWGNQNFLGSFNAGVVVANLLENIRNDLPITND